MLLKKNIRTFYEVIIPLNLIISYFISRKGGGVSCDRICNSKFKDDGNEKKEKKKKMMKKKKKTKNKKEKKEEGREEECESRNKGAISHHHIAPIIKSARKSFTHETTTKLSI